MKENKKFVPQLPNDMVTYIDGKITLAGAIVKYWNDLALYWNVETQQSYFKHYLYELVPHFQDRALEDYRDYSYFNEVIEKIRTEKDNGKRIRKKEDELATDRGQHYRFILERVIKIASEGEEFPNVLLGMDFARENLPTIESVEARQRTRIQKSFSPSQEYAIEEILLRDPLEEGEWVALLLMWVFGFRNKEACAVTWGDIQPLPEHLGLFMLVLHSSNIENTRSSRTGGKSPNMYRIWVIPQRIYDFLMKRKGHIQSLIESGEIKPKKNCKSIDEMPVACKKYYWTTKCTADEISAKAQKMFREIKVTDEQYAYYCRKPDKADQLGIIAWDKDPTAYSLRRNVVTHLFILGLPLQEIQYLMGHDITDDNYRRSDFSNPDVQYAIYQKVKKRPIVNDVNLETEEVEVSENTLLKDVTRLNAKIVGKTGKVVIRITPYRPYEDCSISMKQGSDPVTKEPQPIMYRQVASQMTLPAKAYMIREYYDSYRRVRNRKTALRNGKTE